MVAMLPPQAMASLQPWLLLRMEVSWEPMQVPMYPQQAAYGGAINHLLRNFLICVCNAFLSDHSIVGI